MSKRMHLHIVWYLEQTRRGEFRCGAGGATLHRITQLEGADWRKYWRHRHRPVTPLGTLWDALSLESVGFGSGRIAGGKSDVTMTKHHGNCNFNSNGACGCVEMMALSHRG